MDILKLHLLYQSQTNHLSLTDLVTLRDLQKKRLTALIEREGFLQDGNTRKEQLILDDIQTLIDARMDEILINT